MLYSVVLSNTVVLTQRQVKRGYNMTEKQTPTQTSSSPIAPQETLKTDNHTFRPPEKSANWKIIFLTSH